MKYKKKPIEVEAFKWNGKYEWNYFPQWAKDSIEKGKYPVIVLSKTLDIVYCKVYTLEGIMDVSAGDYIIQGIQGEIYPCKPDIFIKTYEPC